MSDTPKTQSVKVLSARHDRASRLADAFLEWQRLANQNSYPRSIVEIAEHALAREYALGRKAGKR
jgi:hypothetical protein